MAGINKNFIVRNGLQVADQLIFTDVAASRVGIATSIVNYQFHVNGGIGATDLRATGVSTLGNTIVGGATTQLLVNGDARITGIVTIGTSSITLDGNNNTISVGTAVTITGSGDINVTGVSTFSTVNVNPDGSQPFVITDTGSVGIGTTNPTAPLTVFGDGLVTGVVTATTFSGQVNAGVATVTNLFSTDATITNLSGTIGTITTLNSTNGTITNLSGTIGTVTTLNSTTSNITTANIATANIVSGIITTLSGTNLNYSGISTVANLTITPVGTGATVGSVGVVTYYGDGSGLSGVPGQVAIATAGGVVASDVTTIDFRGAGISTVQSAAGIATVNILGLPPGGSDTQVQFNSSGAFDGSANFIFDGTSVVVGSAVTINSSGILVAGIVTATDFNSTSDVNLKENIQTFENALDIVSELRGVRFDWKKDHKPSMGVIAQELEEVLPELVSDTDPKTVNYNGIIGVLIEAVKELSAELKDLKHQINNQ